MERQPQRSAIRFRLPLLVVAASLAGCSTGPSAFWKGYRSDEISAQSSDQGPWGGLSWLQWRAQEKRAFSVTEARTFAEKNGWVFLDQVEYKPGTDSNRTPGGIDANSPKLLEVPSVILRFDSGWIREDPGTGEGSRSYGYVQVSHDGAQMYVHHFWGNG